MSDLHLVGLSDDGSRLVLERSDGEQQFLLVDERVHAALRGDRARLGQLQIALESKLRPREIQARIRSGQTLEEVARDAGIPVERVLRYAGPVLHEREYIAQEAAKAGVKHDDHGAVMLLGELISDRLEERGVPRESAQWDAWRRDDGGWEVRLDYVIDDTERSALWVFDAARRTVTPDDDHARWLLEDEPDASVTPLRSVRSQPKGQTQAQAASTRPEPSPAAEAVRGAVAESESTPAAPRTPQRANAANASAPRQQRLVQDATPTRKKRASVPSWDEILFGSRKPE